MQKNVHAPYYVRSYMATLEEKHIDTRPKME